MSVSQLTPPAKVPCSPSTDSPASPESASFYADDVFEQTATQDIKPVILPQEMIVNAQQQFQSTESMSNLVNQSQSVENTTLTDLDNLTDVLQLPTNWQLELNNLDLKTLTDGADFNFDLGPAQPQAQPVAQPTMTSVVTTAPSTTIQHTAGSTGSHFEFPDYCTPEVSKWYKVNG